MLIWANSIGTRVIFLTSGEYNKGTQLLGAFSAVEMGGFPKGAKTA
jgi:hypothetical protein